MKKLFIILGAAALVLASCAKSETVVKETTPGEMTIKAITSNVTKGAELTGISMPKTYGIYAAATQKNAEGIKENPKFFSGTEQLFGTTAAELADINTAAVGTDDRLWQAGTFTPPSTFAATPIYWPLGGVKMDFLAYAMPMADHNTIAGSAAAAADWTAFWNNSSTDAASMLSFNGVDTYDNQVDVLYANANDRTSANSGSTKYVPMTFNHAQALLIFNIKRNNLDPLPSLVINEIEFITPDRVAALQAGVAAHSPLTDSGLADTDVTLKTIGTFTVDNTRNKLVATWKYDLDEDGNEDEAKVAANYNMPDGVTAKSASNLDAVVGCIDYGASVTYAATYAQLGETLLIPEQPKVNFTMKYTLGGNTYYYTFNDLRGVWEKGKKYIYNIDIALQEIIITETVENFVDALTHPGDGTGTGEVPLS